MTAQTAGPRTASSIIDAATAALTDRFITKLKGLDGLEKFQAKSDLPKVSEHCTHQHSHVIY